MYENGFGLTKDRFLRYDAHSATENSNSMSSLLRTLLLAPTSLKNLQKKTETPSNRILIEIQLNF